MPHSATCFSLLKFKQINKIIQLYVKNVMSTNCRLDVEE